MKVAIACWCGRTFFGGELLCFSLRASDADDMVSSTDQGLSNGKANEARGTETRLILVIGKRMNRINIPEN